MKVTLIGRKQALLNNRTRVDQGKPFNMYYKEARKLMKLGLIKRATPKRRRKKKKK